MPGAKVLKRQRELFVDDDDDDDDDAILAVVESIDTSGNVGGV